MLILRFVNVGNSRISARDSIVILTLIAWAAIVTSASMVSYDLQVKNVAYSSTLEPNIAKYQSDYQILTSEIV